jgi:hypothetical protein
MMLDVKNNDIEKYKKLLVEEFKCRFGDNHTWEDKDFEGVTDPDDEDMVNEWWCSLDTVALEKITGYNSNDYKHNFYDFFLECEMWWKDCNTREKLYEWEKFEGFFIED